MSTHWSRLEREFGEWSNLTFWQRIKRTTVYCLDMLCIPALLSLLVLSHHDRKEAHEFIRGECQKE